MVQVAYVCDGRTEGCGRTRCGFDCRHTTQPEHARFGAVDDPAKYPNRFTELTPGKWAERITDEMLAQLQDIYSSLTLDEMRLDR